MLKTAAEKWQYINDGIAVRISALKFCKMLNLISVGWSTFGHRNVNVAAFRLNDVNFIIFSLWNRCLFRFGVWCRSLFRFGVSCRFIFRFCVRCRSIFRFRVRCRCLFRYFERFRYIFWFGVRWCTIFWCCVRCCRAIALIRLRFGEEQFLLNNDLSSLHWSFPLSFLFIFILWSITVVV